MDNCPSAMDTNVSHYQRDRIDVTVRRSALFSMLY